MYQTLLLTWYTSNVRVPNTIRGTRRGEHQKRPSLRRILLGGEITSQTLQVLNTHHDYPLDAAYLRDVLQVEAVPDTNLVEMVAQGAEQALLPMLKRRV